MSFLFAFPPALSHPGFSCGSTFPFIVSFDRFLLMLPGLHIWLGRSLSAFLSKINFYCSSILKYISAGYKILVERFFPPLLALCSRRCGMFGLSVPRISFCAGVRVLWPGVSSSPPASCSFDYCALRSEFLIFILLGIYEIPLALSF